MLMYCTMPGTVACAVPEAVPMMSLLPVQMMYQLSGLTDPPCMAA